MHCYISGGIVLNWLTPSLRDDFERLAQRLTLDTSEEPATRRQRERITELAALLPGLRLGERRRLLLLADSAPPVEIGSLAEVLEHLVGQFDLVWPALSEHHETIIGRARSHLKDLYEFARQFEDIGRRRKEADRLLKAIDDREVAMTRDDSRHQPLFPYMGYEVMAILPALRQITYPDVLELAIRAR